MRWGLIPPWAKDAKIAYKMINARAETADQKRAYRALLASADRRALLLADGFYEWLRSEDRQPAARAVSLHPRRRRARSRSPACGPRARSTASRSSRRRSSRRPRTRSSRAVHDRMPVILAGPDGELAWLSPELDAAAAKALCVPLAAERMVATPANPLVNKAGGGRGPGAARRAARA